MEIAHKALNLNIQEFINDFEKLFDELITQQQTKVLNLARARLPGITADDILNPHDFAELASDPIFNYEEGIASGILMAQIAVRARLLRSLEPVNKTAPL